MLASYFTSLRRTHALMLGFGFCMGIVFPFYSSIFFDSAAFRPGYVTGCLVAGLLVGTFCYRLIVFALKAFLDRQIGSLRRIAGESAVDSGGSGDQLQMLLALHDALATRIDGAVGRLTRGIRQIAPQCGALSQASHATVEKNEEQEQRFAEALAAARGMEEATRTFLREIEELAARVAERSSLARNLETVAAGSAEAIRSYTASVMETSASIEELAMSIREIAGNVEGLALSAEKTASSITQMDATTAQVRENSARSAALSETARQKTREATRAMSEMLEAMRTIEEASRESGSSIQRLAVHSSRIDTVLKVIGEVVQQTNLLSLNASIIAAQAGEHGKSFAVVAEEVRSLARRTADSTREIEELVGGIQKESTDVQRTVLESVARVESGVAAAARLDGALRMIEEGAAEAAGMAEMSARGTGEQAEALLAITAETDQNLARIRELSRAAKEQERGISLIVRVLEQMRGIATDLTTSTAEQEQGNVEHLRGVEADEQKVAALRDDSLRQLEAAERVVAFISRTGEVAESTAEAGRANMAAVEEIAAIASGLEEELAAFRGQGAAAATPAVLRGVPAQ